MLSIWSRPKICHLGKSYKERFQSTKFPRLNYLTLHHMIPTFNDPKEEGFRKHCGKRRKC